MSMIVMMALMFGIFYFLLIRPQQKQARERSSLLASLQKGDQVVTRGGMIGRISGLQDKVVVLEIQEKVRVRVLLSFIEGRYELDKKPEGRAEKSDAKPEKADKSEKSDAKPEKADKSEKSDAKSEPAGSGDDQ
jgi:preprotein translocase subunit YajC